MHLNCDQCNHDGTIASVESSESSDGTKSDYVIILTSVTNTALSNKHDFSICRFFNFTPAMPALEDVVVGVAMVLQLVS